MDFPGSVVTPTHIHTFGIYSGMNDQVNANGDGAMVNMNWPSANRALYYPISLRFPYLVNRVFWINGSTAGGNTDFGIYTHAGVRLYSTGSTAQSGTDVIQYVTPTSPFTLAPGRYLFAIAFSATSSVTYGTTTAGNAVMMRLAGFLQQSSALPLPATATFAAVGSSAIAFCGVTRTSTGY